MPTEDNFIRFADFPARKDGAAEGRRLMDEAGENAEMFDRGVRMVETEPATTLAGIKAKLDLIYSLLETVEDGDVLTEVGWQTLWALRHGIEEGFARIGPRPASHKQ